ncbi:hypothetical protein [Microbacterium sp. Marseille-Q6965]|uniref:hypothetical protein n=1 Tax=Microbacterium sp. Marseille-Q6965 TaxID=2965072 RepID=UPI0021B7304E|nr:hypothetical protein [Microbacterium sp. Marseille-Q6965]
MILDAASPSPIPTPGVGDGAAIEGLVLAAASGAGGVLLTIVATLIGAWIQGRREHARWLRERRYEAVVRAYGLTLAFELNTAKQMKIATGNRYDGDVDRIKRLQDEADELYATVAESLTPLIVLGPAELRAAVLALQEAYEADDDEARERAGQKFQESARKVLRLGA